MSKIIKNYCVFVCFCDLAINVDNVTQQRFQTMCTRLKAYFSNAIWKQFLSIREEHSRTIFGPKLASKTFKNWFRARLDF